MPGSPLLLVSVMRHTGERMTSLGGDESDDATSKAPSAGVSTKSCSVINIFSAFQSMNTHLPQLSDEERRMQRECPDLAILAYVGGRPSLVRIQWCEHLSCRETIPALKSQCRPTVHGERVPPGHIAYFLRRRNMLWICRCSRVVEFYVCEQQTKARCKGGRSTCGFEGTIDPIRLSVVNRYLALSQLRCRVRNDGNRLFGVLVSTSGPNFWFTHRSYAECRQHWSFSNSRCLTDLLWLLWGIQCWVAVIALHVDRERNEVRIMADRRSTCSLWAHPTLLLFVTVVSHCCCLPSCISGLSHRQ
jgi:hypothetical protein